MLMARSISFLLFAVMAVGILLSFAGATCPALSPSPPSTITNSLVNGPAFRSQSWDPLPAAANDGAPVVWADLNGDGYVDLLHVTLKTYRPDGIQTFYSNVGVNFTEKTQGLNPLNGLVGIPAFADIGELSLEPSLSLTVIYSTRSQVLVT